MKIGVICPSDIAFRRFMPALMKSNNEFVGLAVNSIEERFGENKPEEKIINQVMKNEIDKAKLFVEKYGGKIFYSYEEIINSTDIDVIYIPLPPGLHYKWAKKALQKNKHVLLEKPFTTSFEQTNELIEIAKKNNLTICENYMFVFHNQICKIQSMIDSKLLGDIRLYKIYFGFPRRLNNDFRYNKDLGGGALFDAGGYCLKYSSILLGYKKLDILYSKKNYSPDFNVDLYGSGAVCNQSGDVVQFSYGMDNDYKCELEIWGSKASLITKRILTAPVGYEPKIELIRNNEIEELILESDDTFFKSIIHLIQCTKDDALRNKEYEHILIQARLVDEFLKKSGDGL